MRTFVMGDIHGNYSDLVQCLKKSGFNKKKDRLIQLGDVVDRGPDSFECVEELLTIKNLIAIRGNHDDWFREFIETGYHPAGWNYGGPATIISYLKKSGKSHLIRRTGEGYKTGLSQKDIPETHRNFFIEQIPFYIDENNNCFVHGGFDRHNCFDGQPNQLLYWDRQLWSDALLHYHHNLYDRNAEPLYIKSEFKSIFIGHTPTVNWNTTKPVKAGNIYNIDTGAGHKGKLTIMNVDTKEFYQSEQRQFAGITE